MQIAISDSLYRVSISPDEIKQFNSIWPNSPLPIRPHTFWFDRIGDELVDMIPFNWDSVPARMLATQAQAQARNLIDDAARIAA